MRSVAGRQVFDFVWENCGAAGDFESRPLNLTPEPLRAGQHFCLNCISQGAPLSLVHTRADMTGKLTQRLIDRAKIPAKGQVLIRDGEVIGFVLRITATVAKHGCGMAGFAERCAESRLHGIQGPVRESRPTLRPDEGWAEKRWGRKTLIGNRNPACSKKMNQESASTNLRVDNTQRGEATTAFSTTKRNYRQTWTEVYFK